MTTRQQTPLDDRLEAARRAWPWPQRDAVTTDEVPLHMWPAVELVDALEARLRRVETAAESLVACAGAAAHWTEDEREGLGYLRLALYGTAS